MKATEFIKHHGWEYAKGIIIACESGFLPKNQNYDDLKRIVESHEIVNRVIKDHNKCFPECQIDLIVLKRFAYGKGGKLYPKKLKQAIADVEACKEN